MTDSTIHERLGEVLAHLNNQDKTMARVEAKTEENGARLSELRAENSIMGARITSLEADRDSSDREMKLLSGQVSQINNAASLARWFVHWGPATGAMAATALVAKDWLIRKLGFAN